jgi:hypothetical protein
MRAPYVVSLYKADLSLKGKFQELKYWYIDRQTRKFIPWLANKLPEKLKYWVVIQGMVTVEPNFSPENVTGMQLLNLWKEKAEK